MATSVAISSSSPGARAPSRNDRRASSSRCASARTSTSASSGAHAVRMDRMTRRCRSTSTSASSSRSLILRRYAVTRAFHDDKDHPHLHIAICRIDRQTGRTRNRKNPAQTLSAYARRYEQEHGIVVPRREAIAQAYERRTAAEPGSAEWQQATALEEQLRRGRQRRRTPERPRRPRWERKMWASGRRAGVPDSKTKAKIEYRRAERDAALRDTQDQRAVERTLARHWPHLTAGALISLARHLEGESEQPDVARLGGAACARLSRRRPRRSGGPRRRCRGRGPADSGDHAGRPRPRRDRDGRQRRGGGPEEPDADPPRPQRVPLRIPRACGAAALAFSALHGRSVHLLAEVAYPLVLGVEPSLDHCVLVIEPSVQNWARCSSAAFGTSTRSSSARFALYGEISTRGDPHSTRTCPFADEAREAGSGHPFPGDGLAEAFEQALEVRPGASGRSSGPRRGCTRA